MGEAKENTFDLVAEARELRNALIITGNHSVSDKVTRLISHMLEQYERINELENLVDNWQIQKWTKESAEISAQ